MTQTLNIPSSDLSPSNLQATYQALTKKRMELDLWFSEFLHENEYKMGEDSDTPIWREYKKKNVEYTQLCRQMITTEYYIKRK